VRPEGLDQLKKNSSHRVRTSDLPACSIVSATSRKIAGARPDEVNFFNLPNLSGRKVELGLAQSVTEKSTRNLPLDKRRPAPKADNFTANCEPSDCLVNVGAKASHTPMGLHDLRPVARRDYLFTHLLLSSVFMFCKNPMKQTADLPLPPPWWGP
jgi:hypothetical protein